MADRTAKTKKRGRSAPGLFPPGLNLPEELIWAAAYSSAFVEEWRSSDNSNTELHARNAIDTANMVLDALQLWRKKEAEDG